MGTYALEAPFSSLLTVHLGLTFLQWSIRIDFWFFASDIHTLVYLYG